MIKWGRNKKSKSPVQIEPVNGKKDQQVMISIGVGRKQYYGNPAAPGRRRCLHAL